MKLYYYNKKDLYDILHFKKINIEYDFTARFEITNTIIKKITTNLSSEIKNEKLRAAILTFQYKYIYENLAGLIYILQLRNEFNKKTFVIKSGNPGIFKVKEISEFNFASKDGFFYYCLVFLAYLKKGASKKKYYEFKKIILLIKRDNLSTRIWNLICSEFKIENEIRDEDFFGFSLKDYSEMNIPAAVHRDLLTIKKLFGKAFYLKIKYYIKSGVSYFKKNPTENFITFEQHTLSYMILSYLSEFLNIRSLSIAHAVINVDYKRHLGFDHCLVYGKSSEETFEREDSIVCGKIYKTGAPIMDNMFRNIPETKSFSNKVLYLADYITNFGYDIEEVHVAKNNLLKSFLLKFSKVSLTVKYHPAKINPYTDKILSGLKNVEFKQNVDIHTEIDQADVVVCDGWSSSGLECAIRKKPLIVLNVKQRRKDYYKYYKSGYGINVTDEESMFQAYEKISNAGSKVNESARNELIEYHLENTNAAGVTANVLQNIIAA